MLYNAKFENVICKEFGKIWRFLPTNHRVRAWKSVFEILFVHIQNLGNFGKSWLLGTILSYDVCIKAFKLPDFTLCDLITFSLTRAIINIDLIEVHLNNNKINLVKVGLFWINEIFMTNILNQLCAWV